MKKKILLASLALLLNSSTWATLKEPEKCPSINAIQSSGLSSSQKDVDGNYAVCNTSNYDTQDTWTFIINNIEASSQYEAYNQAINALNTLSGNPEPTYINGHFGCHYDIGFGYSANAYNAQPTICKS